MGAVGVALPTAGASFISAGVAEATTEAGVASTIMGARFGMVVVARRVINGSVRDLLLGAGEGVRGTRLITPAAPRRERDDDLLHQSNVIDLCFPGADFAYGSSAEQTIELPLGNAIALA